MKRRKSMGMVFIVLLMAELAGSAWAADQSQSGQPGRSTPGMMCQQRFDTMDADHNGVITKAEFMTSPHPGGRGEEVFKSRDTNGDGGLTKDEFCAGRGMGGGMGKGRMQ